ncbi:RNA modification protein [Candidatus Uzinura diaspidicola str. ASNER]|uniref:tRNA-2-methylthio-N(6)-dimethylallyladenosine synthase n=1 Tax=Candidatus Uzinura diaspidicola str. ASNER TaxID=1133592 RepID=L7VN35_9FLAO|nr:RNA modification protein [Candidatus Uzinura diaspidicola str. ASNER]
MMYIFVYMIFFIKNERKLYIENYGCQMNLSDSEIISSLLAEEGFFTFSKIYDADLILLNTCSIREKAESNIRRRLIEFQYIKKKKPSIIIGLLGCMAERLKKRWLEEEKIVDLVVGPDSYRALPMLISRVEDGKSSINVLFSKEENYADVNPIRLGDNGITAFVSITRGCDNMCSFCVVPFTRGRERSRDPASIIKECQKLWSQGYKEVNLLGQNVDSYFWYGGGMKKDFSKASPLQKATYLSFADLLELVARSVPKMRIRFSTSNPYDITENVLKIISHYPNICKYIHLPLQSGSTRVLELMNRRYTSEKYVSLIRKIRKIITDCAISHDIIAGFSGEFEEDHRQTLNLMEYVRYDFGYMFIYSLRTGTKAEKSLFDDVPEEIKKRRLQEILFLQKKHSYECLQAQRGKIQEVLIEGESRKSKMYWYGRNSQNAVVVFPKDSYRKGDFVKVRVKTCTSATLLGQGLEIV